MKKILIFFTILILTLNTYATESNDTLIDRYNLKKDYFDYSVVLSEFPQNYYYTSVKINKSKKRILIITDKVNADKSAFYGLFYYYKKNGFVYPLGYLESKKLLSQSENYLYLNEGNKDTKFYISDKKFSVIKPKFAKNSEIKTNIKFETIKSADKFKGDFGSPAGDDVIQMNVEGFSYEFHKTQYKKKYIKNLMKECIKDGVKTDVQMYYCVVKKIHG